MPLLSGLLFGVVLIGALALGAAVCLSRGTRRMVVETHAPPDRPGTLTLQRESPSRAPVAENMAPAPPLPEAVSGLNKTQAENLLDWLQAHGHIDCEVSYDEQTGFTVHCH